MKLNKPSTWFNTVVVVILALTLLAKAVGWAFTTSTLWTVVLVLVSIFLFGQSMWLEKKSKRNAIIHRISGYLAVALLIVAFSPAIYLETAVGRVVNMFIIGASAVWSIVEIFVN